MDMAQKRMFDRSITDNENFANMPMSAKALYFLLGMEADDEGFVSPRKVMGYHGANIDDLNILIAKNYCIRFESGIIVITHWHSNNYLDKSRIKRTQYQDERKLLGLTNMNRYVFNNGLTSVVQSRVEENKTPLGGELGNAADSELSPEARMAKITTIKDKMFRAQN